MFQKYLWDDRKVFKLESKYRWGRGGGGDL